MYYISKRIEVAGSHSLALDYESKCSNLHGHNWIITIYCKSEQLNKNGMICDFAIIKKRILEQLDHKNLNDVLSFNPTAENISKWICEQVSRLCETGFCYRVEVQESEGNIAIYER